MSVAINSNAALVTPEQLSAIQRICRRFGVRWLAVFGSFARGEAKPDSDIDLLLEWNDAQRMTLITLEELAEALGEVFDNRPIDLGRPQQLHWYLRDRILAEARVLYEG